jgi:hypothetical protein
MSPNGRKGRSLRAPVQSLPLVVVVCQDPSVVDLLTGSAESAFGGSFVTYGRMEDMALNPPSGAATMIVLADLCEPAGLRGALEWLGRYWPRCARVVISTQGGMETEIAARAGGALYFVHPVLESEWNALLDYATSLAGELAERE